MVCKISWTPRAWKTYCANIEYLEKQWTEKEITAFVLAADKRIDNLAKQPEIGTPRNKKYPNIRHTVIHKRIVLIYKYKPVKEEIELLVFWNTYQHPRKLNIK